MYVLESGECWNRLARMVSLDQPPFLLFRMLATVWGCLKLPQCSEGGGRGSHSSGGGARSASSLSLLSGHLPRSWRRGLDLLGVLSCLKSGEPALPIT